MADIKSVLLWENQRRYVRDALATGTLKAALVPTGSTEQHNEHLALSQDTDSALHVSRLAARALFPAVIVATPVAVGISEHWMRHKGTLSLRPEVFADVVFDVCNSLARHGVPNILIVNGHGGNVDTLKGRLADFRSRIDARLDFCSYWDVYGPGSVARYLESGKCPGHASEFETAFALSAFPENIDWEGVDERGAFHDALNEDWVDAERDSHRDAKLATAGKGEAMIRIAVDGIKAKLEGMMAAGE